MRWLVGWLVGIVLTRFSGPRPPPHIPYRPTSKNITHLIYTATYASYYSHEAFCREYFWHPLHCLQRDQQSDNVTVRVRPTQTKHFYFQVFSNTSLQLPPPPPDHFPNTCVLLIASWNCSMRPLIIIKQGSKVLEIKTTIGQRFDAKTDMTFWVIFQYSVFGMQRPLLNIKSTR
jgi:hypothetical protein